MRVGAAAGEATRVWGARITGVAKYCGQQNVGKRNISPELNKPEALQILRDIAEISDVVVENFRPGVAERMGLDRVLADGAALAEVDHREDGAGSIRFQGGRDRIWTGGFDERGERDNALVTDACCRVEAEAPGQVGTRGGQTRTRATARRRSCPCRGDRGSSRSAPRRCPARPLRPRNSGGG